MILKLVIILQTWSTIHGATDPEKYIKKVQINATCRADKIKVAEYLQVEKWCFMMCKNKTTDWREKTTEDFSDERLCNYDPFDPPIPVAITGKCVNGSCRNPDSIAKRTNKEPACFDYERMMYDGEEVAVECKKSCYINGSIKDVNLKDGEKCVYEKAPYLFGLSEKVTKVGTCKGGSCSKTEGCLGKKLLVYPGFSVDKDCAVNCSGNQRKQLDNGTMCALRTSTSGFSFWSIFRKKPSTLVQEIGNCYAGKCVRPARYIVPPHNTTKGCNGTNVFIHQNLTVATHCQADCGDGTSEHREEGIFCLWQYRRHEHLHIYRIGFCFCGICEPHDNYTVLVDSKNPPVKNEDHLLESY
uniref:Putative mucin n=1 Tax=Ixodes ricinus TaxID=34613 RepID=A0A6B0VAY2_IXORI